MGGGVWRIGGGRSVDLSAPRVMGILNITPDSFSEGGRYDTVQLAVERALELVEGGAELLDIGGESTRPGAERVVAAEQIQRVVPVIRAIREAGIAVPLSIDTTLAEVAEAAIDAGAGAGVGAGVGAEIINDVAAGTESEGMLGVAARTGAGLVLMHRLREPGADSYSHAYPKDPEYPGGVVHAVRAFLEQRVEAALGAGVKPEAIVIDPGLGFGKSVSQNYELIARTAELLELGYPLLSAASRKSFIGAPSGADRPEDRLAGSLAVTLAHERMGVRLFRVHDAREHTQALRVARAIGNSLVGQGVR
jgi:dihydropteroate synthase